MNDSEDNQIDESGIIQIDLDLEVECHGKFQNSEIIFATLLANNALLSIEKSGFMNVFNARTTDVIFSQRLGFEPTCCEFDSLKSLLYFGTSKGCLRIFELQTEPYNLIDRSSLRVDQSSSIQTIKFLPKTEIGCLKCVNKNELYIFVFDYKANNLKFYGSLTFDLQVHHYEWTIKSFTTHLTILLGNGLLLGVPILFEDLIPTDSVTNLNDRIANSLLRKIDSDCEKFVYSPGSESVYAYGSDYVVKHYKMPHELATKLDMKNKYPIAPIEEFIVFDIFPRVAKMQEGKLIFGCENGDILAFDVNNQDMKNIQILSQFSGGVSFLAMANQSTMIVGGCNGCLMTVDSKWIGLGDDKEAQPNEAYEQANIDSNRQQIVTDMAESSKPFKSTIEHFGWPRDDFVDTLEQRVLKKGLEEIRLIKEAKHAEFIAKLEKLRDDYAQLMSENQQLDDQFKLTSEECFIDVERREEMKVKIAYKSSIIREEAYRLIMNYQLTHKKIKEMSFSQMDTHISTITGLLENTIVFNFPIVKKEQKEAKFLKKIMLIRNMEKRERAWTTEHPSADREDVSYQKDLLDHRASLNIVNNEPRRPKMVLANFEKRQKAIKEYEEEKRKKTEALQNANNNPGHRKIELVNRRVKKKRGAAFSFNKTAHVSNNPNDSRQQLNKLQKSASVADNGDCWSYVYSSLELTTHNKKISQIYLIKNVIRSIKEEFNNEFSNVFKAREKKIDLINENLKKINEIYIELQQENPGFTTFPNVLNSYTNKRQECP